MENNRVQNLDLEHATHLTLIVGLSCRDLRGFVFMWTHIWDFIWVTKKSAGCVHILPGVASPFSILLVSYWESPKAMMGFVSTPAHRRWMQFMDKHPRSLNLFNETYSRPQKANFVNKPQGYASSLVTRQEGSAL